MRTQSARPRRTTSVPAAVFAAVVILAPFLLALLVSTPARADDTELGASGGTVVARSGGDVRLVAETVQAVCFGTFAEYRVDFRFVNDGRTRRVRLGFPFAHAVSGYRGTERPFGFQAWQEGRPLPVKVVGAGGTRSFSRSPRGYFVHVARFPRGATTITVSYLAQSSATAMSRRRGGLGVSMAHWYEYWLHTGGTWKGPIGSAVVRFAFADSFRGRGIGLTAAEANRYVKVTTPGWTRPLPATCQWRFGTFEPRAARGEDWWTTQPGSDIVLGFSRDYDRPGSRVKWTASGKAASSAAGGDPASAGDGLLSTCWTVGPLSRADHPWLEAAFRQPRRVRELRIVTGDDAYLAAFTRYGRPRTMTATFSDGSSAVLHLRDAPVLQRFPVDVTTSAVKLTVDEVYPGSDYPAVSLAEVEFGRSPAPRYAGFTALLTHDAAPGRLPAWAGRVLRGVRAAGQVDEWQARQDAEAVAGGDLIGVDEISRFPNDKAPFRQRSSLEELQARAVAVDLPAQSTTGKLVSVDSLSRWTFDLRYASGVEMLVATRVGHVASANVLRELLAEAGGMSEYADGRKLPYEVTTIGGRVVGVAKAGTIPPCCEEGPAVHVPAQVFWRDGDATYHLYAREKGVSVTDLTSVARSMLVTQVHFAPPAAAAGRGGHPWWWAAVLVAALVALAVVLTRLTARPHPESR
jgi:hypothetical protein